MFGAVILALAAIGTPRPIAITVDDLPIASGDVHPEQADRRRITEGLLAAFAKHHITAVGLVTWKNVHGPEDRALLEAWLAKGHELGNHSFNHLDYTHTEVAAYVDDVERARRSLEELLAPHKKTVRYFRFPFLDEGETKEKLEAMRKYLAESKQTNLPVTIDDQDWSYEKRWVAAKKAGDEHAKKELAADYQAMMRSEVRHFEDEGDALFGRSTPQIILLHAGEVGADLWDDLFDWLEKTGHRFVPVSDVLADTAFSGETEFTGELGVSIFDRIRLERRAAESKKQIADLLDTQAKAWNRGDHEAFCAAYTDDATFISPSGMTQGRSAIVARYKKKYASKAEMGSLSLEVLEQRVSWGFEVTRYLDAEPSRIHGATVIMRWRLVYPDKPKAEGLSLISLRPRPGQKGAWMIVQDASM